MTRKHSDAMRRYLVTAACCTALCCSCSYESPEVYERSALGVTEDYVEIPVEGGDGTFNVLSNGSYSISPADGEYDWLSFPPGASGDEGFSVTAAANQGVPRTAALALSLGSSRDTVYVYQDGAVESRLSLNDYGFVLGSDAGAFQTEIETNIPASDISVKAGSGLSWISGLEVADAVSGTALRFSYEANNTPSIRKGVISISYRHGRDGEVSELCYLTQSGSETQMRDASFAEVRSLAVESGQHVSDDIVIEGIVVSNRASGNMGDNEQTSTFTIDYSISERTVYLESADGAMGFMLLTETEDDNNFSQFDHVKIDLNGAVIAKSVVSETRDPVYYTISGVRSDMVVSRVEGSSAPVKRKRIGNLDDDDIFTYVTLADVELPVRKGPLTPVEEYFTNAGGNNRLTKYGTLLRCVDGESIYVYTNTTCVYRRDGSRLPYGSGDMSGVIVHERLPRYRYEDAADSDEYGYIGRYQIRHTSKSDFGMADSMEESSFSALLAEWRYVTEKNLVTYPATGGSDTDAWFTQTYEYPESSSLHGRSCVNLTADYSYLGPVGTNASYFFGRNIGNVNGLGVILEDGTDWMGPSYKGVNSSAASSINSSGNAGKGIVPAEAGSAWYAWYNRDRSDGSMKSWLIKFSTKGITSDVFSLQVSMVNKSNSGNYGPRYWNLEYSFTDITGNGNETEWTLIDTFTVPDFAASSPFTQFWMLPGFMPMNFRLPSDIGDKDAVYLRLRPEDGKIGTTSAYLTDRATNSTMPWSAMNYIAVRYNK